MSDWVNGFKIKVGEIETAVNEGNLRKNDLSRKQNELLLYHLIRNGELVCFRR